MATWNVDRKKGGTYEFEIDAQGNYQLKKSGFGDVKSLNLPELKAEAAKATTATTTQDTKKLSDQTQKAFGDVQPFYYQGGGRDASQYTTEYDMTKDKSLDTDQTYYRPNMREVSGEVQPMTTDEGYKDAIMRGGKGATYQPKRNEKSIFVDDQGNMYKGGEFIGTGNEKSIRVN